MFGRWGGGLGVLVGGWGGYFYWVGVLLVLLGGFEGGLG